MNAMNSKKRSFAAGADIGGTDIKFILLDGNGEVTSRCSFETDARGGPDQALRRVAEEIEALLESNNLRRQDLSALGVGAAGPLDTLRGILVQAPNLPGWEGTPITDILRVKLGMPVFLENDANLAAFGEHRAGAGKGSDNIICLTLGTGIGSGIIIDREIFCGALGAGAELGHITINPSGAMCNCGNRGCLEAMASATAVARMARHILHEGRGRVISELVAGDEEKVTAETVHQAAIKGDGDAAGILEKAGRYLGMGIASAVNIFAPQMVIIGGGMMSAGDFILKPARDEAMRRALKPFTRGLSIVPAELGGWAGAMGAAFYARQKTGGP